MFILLVTEPPYLLIADGHYLRSFDLLRKSGPSVVERPSFTTNVNSTSRIDSVTVDLTGSRWTAYMLSYHSKSILQTDITSLQKKKNAKIKSAARRKAQSSTAVKPAAMSPSTVIVSL